jgi:hypothetical protein
LKAADALWQSGGEEAVTIRGVAAEEATTTPTVYNGQIPLAGWC